MPPCNHPQYPLNAVVRRWSACQSRNRSRRHANTHASTLTQRHISSSATLHLDTRSRACYSNNINNGNTHSSSSSTSTSTSSAKQQQSPFIKTTKQSSPDAHPLRFLFDSSSFHQNFILSGHGSALRPTGLFGRLELSSPIGFRIATARALKLSQQLVSKVVTSYRQYQQGNEAGQVELSKIVKRLDRLSDLLCSVVDTAELVRHVHPEPSWVEASNEAHALMSNYLNTLNTNTELYDALKLASQEKGISKDFTNEETKVAELLLHDFEKSGIHLPKAQRNRYITLNDHILQTGHAFTLQAYTPISHVTVDDPKNALLGLPDSIIHSLSNRTGTKATIPIRHPIAHQILSQCRNESTRKKVFLAMNTGSRQSLELLNDMLLSRHELAQILGKNSYGEVWMGDKMLMNPENVITFLNSLAEAHKPLAQTAVNRLASMKQAQSSTTTSSNTINAWDKMFYSRFLTPPSSSSSSSSSSYASSTISQDPHHRHTNANSPISESNNISIQEYCSLGTVLTSVSNLFEQIYGIRLDPSPSQPGETWHPSVRKLLAKKVSTNETIGVIYMDLLARSDGHSRKYETPAHFTVRGSRFLGFDETLADPLMDANVAEEFGVDEEWFWRDLRKKRSGTSSSSFAKGLFQSWANQTTSKPNPTEPDSCLDNRDNLRQNVYTEELDFVHRHNPEWQLPVVVVVTNFVPNVHVPAISGSGNDEVVLLSWGEIETLYHELGHAMHSMLSRTSYQHISGTRIQMDFVEFPSILMEKFLQTPFFLTQLRHYHHHTPLPTDFISTHFRTHTTHRQDLLLHDAIDTQFQIVMALLDQIYHSPLITPSLQSIPSYLHPFIPSQSASESSTLLLKHLQSTHHVIPYPSASDKVLSTAWQTQFTHLFAYGSGYYTYFWCRKWANKVFEKLFETESMEFTGTDRDKWSRSGELLWKNVMGVGGGKSGWEMLSGLGVLEEKDMKKVLKGELRDVM